ncbi:MAG: phosphoglycerate kinase [Nanoarchaeota archaeon]|nr:phosphoglycerate kinase [Nanoarchaeota archaeon]MBU1269223.1 phosphoglycerate kinase [Nanoarchaeota archaeon]MBU1603859.1 phosphoglycerate kinase [Nanoarchaeota archaeon]MBU2443060.1 phosphoglycerate kinase [Nanoarchaeota archaeon]
MRTITQVDITNLRVLLRVDYNVPIDDKGEILDDFKIKESLPTIRYILKSAKQLIIISHLGRPKDRPTPELKLDKVALRLMKHLGRNIAKLNDCVNIDIPDEKVVMLENLRFHKEEELNDEGFAKKLASYADFFVNDAFAVSHRAHSSVVGVTKFLPSCAGFLLQKEVENLDFRNPKRPFVVIMGGSKLSTKFHLINKLVPMTDKLLLGGAIIFTFYKSQGFEIGKSLCEDDQLTAAKLLSYNEKIVLPKDVVVAPQISEKAPFKTVNFKQIPKEEIGLDLGADTIKDFKSKLKKAKTVFWNGPLGYYEIENFSKSTYEIAKLLSTLDAKVVIGGGDSAAFVQKLGLMDKFTHVSTGGGASLELIENGSLPGIDVLKH